MDSQNVTTQSDDFELKLSNDTLLQHQMYRKNFCTILHSQFNYHTLPVTPFKLRERKRRILILDAQSTSLLFKPLFK